MSAGSASKPPVRARTGSRLLLGLAFVAALILLGTAGAGWWLWSTTGGLMVIVRALNATGGVVIDAQQPAGSLRDGFSFARFNVEAGATSVQIERVRARLARFGFDPWRFDLDELAAERVAVNVRPTGPSTGAPESIASPIIVTTQRLRVGAFELNVGATALAAREIDGKVTIGPDGYRVDGGSFAFGAQRASLDGRLGGAQPFALDARSVLQTALDDKPVTAKIAASGSLIDLALAAQVEGGGADGTIEATVASFDAVPLKRLAARLAGVDPRAWDARAPKADLRVEADLMPAAPPASAPTAFVLRGPVTVVNSTPGPIDAERLPVRALTSTIEWHARELALSDFDADLVRGRVRGAATINLGSAPSWQVDARVSGVDPSALHSRAKPLQLDGTARAKRTTTKDDNVDDFVADLVNRGTLPARLAVDLRATAQRVVLNTGRLSLGKGLADLRGEWQRGGSQALRASAVITDFEPALLVKGLDARINGTIEVDGRLQPQPAGTLRFELADSRLLGRPLTGRGTAQLDAGLEVDAQLAVRSARVEARGGLGRAGDLRALNVTIEVPSLQELALPVQGALSARATLRGAWDAPSVEARATFAKLRAGEHAIEALRLQFDHAGGRDGVFALRTQADQHRFSDHDAASLRSALFIAEGRLAQHRLSFTATTETSEAISAAATGGWQGKSLKDGGWRGELTQASAGAPLHLRLLAPVPVAIDAAQWSIGPADLALADARVEGLRAAMDARGITTAGRFNGLRPFVLAGARAPERLTGLPRAQSPSPLELRGEWNLRLGETADGELLVERASGDLLASLGNPMGLREFRVQARVRANQLEAQALLDAERAGIVRASMTAALERVDRTHWSLAQQRPWTIDATAALPALDGLNALLSDRVHANLRIGGLLEAKLNVGGTPGAPLATGAMRGEKLRVAWIDQGVRFENGTLSARVDGDTIYIDELRFAGAPQVRPDDKRAAAAAGVAPGFVSATGRLTLRDFSGVIQVAAQRLPLLQRPDRWVIATGGANVELSKQRVQVNGAVAADAGYVNFSRADLPSLSEDIVIRRKGDAEAAREPRVQFGFDLGIDLGPAFFLRGGGLDTRIDGAVRLRSEGRGIIRASGTVEARDGTYEGFGQKIAIARGRVNFQGPLENPGLDILAVRTGLPVQVGVAITRTAANPLIRLYSDQGLEDTEILSWLVLGRPADRSGADNIALARAAAALLSGSGEGIPTRLARSLGIDEVSLRSGDLAGSGSLLPRQSVAGSLRGADVTTATNEIITIGKRVSDVVTLTYEQTLTGTANVVALSYQISRRLSLVARAGTENAIDLVYTFAFD